MYEIPELSSAVRTRERGMTFTLQRHRAVGPVSTLAAAALLLAVTACQDDGEGRQAASCSGVAPRTISAILGTEDFEVEESGPFPHTDVLDVENPDGPDQENWTCVVRIDDDAVLQIDAGLVSRTHEDIDYEGRDGRFGYRGGSGNIAETEASWLCHHLMFYVQGPEFSEMPFPRPDMAAMLVSLADASGCST